MKHKTALTMDVPLSVDVVTGETCSRAVQKVIEVLLYQRNQIPFCYDTFRTIVAKFVKKEATQEGEDPDWKDYRLVKQRDAAVDTLDRIRQLFKELPTVTSQGSSVLLLFGSTVYTAKEAFQVNLPPVNPDHHADLHRPALETALKQLAMALTLSEELQTGSERITGPTRMFLLVNRVETESEVPCPSWQRMEEFRLPASCRRHVINLFQNSRDVRRLTCCKEMPIYEEEGDVEIGQEAMEVEEEGEEEPEELALAWYQIGEGLKGYKDAEVKGKLIWNCGS
ncbi:uncharacterized protein LOC120412552 [Culex pipiens pallens]|uniref:uncharacterized protein LOC120412552 n=1 Tax=Culex pipiens pallens TaxID=42434 RepID=UPI001953E2D2|nr:uncharacterized protein LOC120412552 [Culex pipiens pallens]